MLLIVWLFFVEFWTRSLTFGIRITSDTGHAKKEKNSIWPKDNVEIGTCLAALYCWTAAQHSTWRRYPQYALYKCLLNNGFSHLMWRGNLWVFDRFSWRVCASAKHINTHSCKWAANLGNNRQTTDTAPVCRMWQRCHPIRHSQNMRNYTLPRNFTSKYEKSIKSIISIAIFTQPAQKSTHFPTKRKKDICRFIFDVTIIRQRVVQANIHLMASSFSVK